MSPEQKCLVVRVVYALLLLYFRDERVPWPGNDNCMRRWIDESVFLRIFEDFCVSEREGGAGVDPDRVVNGEILHIAWKKVNGR